MIESTLSMRFTAFLLVCLLLPCAFIAYAAEPPGDPAEPPAPDESAVDSPDADSAADLEPAPAYTIWDKPFAEYSPTEGYLFLLFVLVLSFCSFKIFKGGI